MHNVSTKHLPIIGFAVLFWCANPVVADETPSEHIAGELDSSARWGSGWLDLAVVTDFKAGDQLRLRIGGSAAKIVVRLLAKRQSANSSTGTIGGIIDVPDSRVVEIRLHSSRKGIVQISVHGGTDPWGRFPLGAENGPATLEGAELVRSKR